MRMWFLIGVIACGGGKTPPPVKAPEPIATTQAPPPAPSAPAPVQPAPPPPAPPAPAPLRDRLHDEDGPIAGMPGWSVKRVADDTACGGTRVVVSKGRRKLDPDQAALAKLYEVQFPADLSFDLDNKPKRDASLKRFDDYVAQMTKIGGDANRRYEAVVGDANADMAARTAAAARIAQVSLRFASALARAPIPKDVRSGEFAKDKIDAFCEKMEEVAEPLAQRAQQALDACAAKAPGEGWWTPLCTSPKP